MARVAVIAACLALAVASDAGAGTMFFRTPTGNIGCVFWVDIPGSARPTVRCDIRSGLVPQPRRPASCRLNYGDSLELRQPGRTIHVCHGDTAIDPHSRVLAYGQTWRRDGLSCSSQSIGLTCRNRSGHGFFLSRQSWRIF